MRWQELLQKVGDEPVFSSALLLAGDVSPAEVHRQLTRWVKAGKVLQLRRGLYSIAEPYQKVSPHPFLIANHLKSASYVSLQSALSHHGMIPEYVPVVTSVTTGRPGRVSTGIGNFEFRHVKKEFFWGYREVEVATNQRVFLASPEKSLLDLVYFTPGGDKAEFIEELRLQNLSVLDKEALSQAARKSGSPKLEHAASHIVRLIDREGQQRL